MYKHQYLAVLTFLYRVVQRTIPPDQQVSIYFMSKAINVVRLTLEEVGRRQAYHPTDTKFG